MGFMPITQQNRWILGWNVGDKVVDNPPIKQLRYHPAIVALSEIRPSNTPLKSIVVELFTWVDVHRGNYATCGNCCYKSGNLGFGI